MFGKNSKNKKQTLPTSYYYKTVDESALKEKEEKVTHNWQCSPRIIIEFSCRVPTKMNSTSATVPWTKVYQSEFERNGLHQLAS